MCRKSTVSPIACFDGRAARRLAAPDQFRASVWGRPKSVRGFTTIELLVVMALMLVVVSASASIFLLVSRIQKRIIANQQVQGNVRFALETMVRDIHVGMIDYDYYQSQELTLIDALGVVSAMQVLALKDEVNQPVRYRLYAPSPDSQTLQVSRGFTENWQNLLSDNVQVANVRFYIVPASDPFQLCGSGSVDCESIANEQPRVTVVLTAQNVPEPGYPVSTLWLQTTILTRSYRR